MSTYAGHYHALSHSPKNLSVDVNDWKEIISIDKTKKSHFRTWHTVYIHSYTKTATFTANTTYHSTLRHKKWQTSRTYHPGNKSYHLELYKFNMLWYQPTVSRFTKEKIKKEENTFVKTFLFFYSCLILHFRIAMWKRISFLHGSKSIFALH